MTIYQLISDIPSINTRYFASYHAVMIFVDNYCLETGRWSDFDNSQLRYDEEIDPGHHNLPVSGHYMVRCKDKTGKTVDMTPHNRVFCHYFLINIINVEGR